MAQYQSGADALNALNATNEGGSGNKVEFAPFKVGTTYKVRVLGTADLIQFYSYGVYRKVNSFAAKNPSKKNAKGFPVEDLTPWDKAFKYYQDKAFEAREAGDTKAEEEFRSKAYLFKPKERFAMGFIDLATGEPIIVDLSKNQAKAVHAVIMKNEKKLGKVAFELSKTGGGQQTTVMLSLLFDLDEDLNDTERENFAKYDGKEFDMSLFDGLLYEADEDEQIENLIKAGFDVSLIGYDGGIGDNNEEQFDF